VTTTDYPTKSIKHVNFFS